MLIDKSKYKSMMTSIICVIVLHGKWHIMGEHQEEDPWENLGKSPLQDDHFSLHNPFDILRELWESHQTKAESLYESMFTPPPPP